MIWVLSVLLLLLDGGLALPVNGSQVAVINTLHETVEGLQKSIEGLYSKLKVVEDQLQNGEAGSNMHKMVYKYWGDRRRYIGEEENAIIEEYKYFG